MNTYISLNSIFPFKFSKGYKLTLKGKHGIIKKNERSSTWSGSNRFSRKIEIKQFN